MSPYLPDATPSDRARSLARSHLRLVRALQVCGVELTGLPAARGERLRKNTEVVVQLEELLGGDARTQAESAAALAADLERRAEELERLRSEILAGLPPESRRRVRQTMLQVAVTDEDLAEQQRELQALANLGRRPEPNAAPGTTARAEAGRLAVPPQSLLPDGARTAGLLDDAAARLEGLDGGQLDELTQLLGPLFSMFDVDEVLADLEQGWRQEQEQRALPLSPGLGKALQTVPAHWVEAIHRTLQLPRRRRRAERVKDIVEALQDEDGLRQAVGQLGKQEREGLRLLVEQGGWLRGDLFCRRFGGDQGDGWFWLDNPPSSVLGRLRLHGLAYVGQAQLEGRPVRVVVVPGPLREALARLLWPQGG